MKFPKIICYFIVTLTCCNLELLAQNKSNTEELVLQSYHTGYKILDIAVDPAGTKVVSVGDDKNILFYDILQRHIYNRVKVSANAVCKRITLDHTTNQVIYLENNTLIFRSLSTGKETARRELQPLLDSLKLKSLDHDYLETDLNNNTLSLLATGIDPKFFLPKEHKILVFELGTGKLKTVSQPISVNSGKVNGIASEGDKLLVLTSEDGLMELKADESEPVSLWKPESGDDTPASFKIAGNLVWLLTSKYFYLLQKQDWSVIKKFSLGTSPSLTKNHPFTVDADGKAYLYNPHNDNLQTYTAAGVAYFDAMHKAYLPSKLITANDKNFLLVANKNTLSILDTKQEKQLLELKSSLTPLDNWSFFRPGIAYATAKNKDAFLQVDLTRGLISRENADENDYLHEYLLELPKSNLKGISNGLFVNFIDANTNTFRFGISLQEQKYVTDFDHKLAFGSTKGATTPFISADEKLLVSPTPLACAVQVWDLERKVLLREISLAPLNEENNNRQQIIDHIAFHPTEKLIYVETSDNAMGNLEALVVDAVSGNVLIREAFHQYGFSGSFFPAQKAVVLPGELHNEARIIDLDTKLAQVIPVQMNRPIVSPDEHSIYHISQDTIYQYNLAAKKGTALGEHPDAKDLLLDYASQLLISTDRNNSLKIWDTVKGTLSCTAFINIPEHKAEAPSYLFISPDNYYLGGGNYSQFLLLKKNGVMVPFEQFDRIYNRPDLLLSSIGRASPQLLAQLTKATSRRAQLNTDKTLAGFTSVISNKSDFKIESSNRNLTIHLKAAGSPNQISSYQVWVNGVSLYPNGGNKTQKTELSEQVLLTEVQNRIEVAFWDSEGNESSHDLLIVNLPASPKPSLWLVSMGVSDYQDSTYNLHYASKDVEDVAKYLKTAKSFKKVNTLLLKDKQVTKASFNQVNQFLAAAAPEDVVMIFYAGHGLLNEKLNYYLASNTMDFSTPEKEGIPVEFFEKALYQSKARKKVLLIDACHSGLIEEPVPVSTHTYQEQNNIRQTGRGVGISAARDRSIDAEVLQSAFLNLNKGEGLTIIAASSGTELAYEDPTVSNGLFTYSFLEGLKTSHADLNKDKTITLSEIKDYVEKRVLVLSKGKQRPTNRRWNNYFDFKVWDVNDRVNQQFFDAVMRDDTTAVANFIQTGYSVNVIDEATGFTPLHFAARDNRLQTLRQLIRKGADLEAKSTLGGSPLYLSVLNNNVQATYALIVAGAKVQGEAFYYKEKGKLTLAQIALENNNKQIAMLLTNSEKLTQQDPAYRNMIRAVFAGNIAHFTSLYEQYKPDLNFVLPDLDLSLLHYAAFNRNVDIAKFLLSKGALPGRLPYAKFSPLHVAAYQGDAALVKLLLEAGADKEEKDEDGKRPWDYLTNDDPILKALLN